MVVVLDAHDLGRLAVAVVVDMVAVDDLHAVALRRPPPRHRATTCHRRAQCRLRLLLLHHCELLLRLGEQRRVDERVALRSDHRRKARAIPRHRRAQPCLRLLLPHQSELRLRLGDKRCVSGRAALRRCDRRHEGTAVYHHRRAQHRGEVDRLPVRDDARGHVL